MPRRFQFGLALVAVFSIVSPLPGQTGELRVITATFGTNVDTDGYVVALDEASQSVSVNGSIAFKEVAVGAHTVALLDVAESCSVIGDNPRTAMIARDGLAEVRFEVLCDGVGEDVASERPSARPSTTRNKRVGLWGGFGFGAGNLGCLEGCNRIWGISGNARLGGTPSPYVRLAGGTNGYYKEENGASLTASVVTFQVLWFPSAKDLFLIFGVGGAAAQVSAFGLSETEGGAGFLFGVGYDAPVNRSGSLAITPFVNWVTTTLEGKIDFFQFGVGLTFN